MIYQVPQNHVIIIERLGKYSETKHAGLRIRLPFVESPKDMSHWAGIATKRKRLSHILISQQEQVMDTESQPCITRDNITIDVNAILFWQIVDPIKSVYEIENLPLAVGNVALTTLRDVVGRMSLDEVISERNRINTAILDELQDVSEKWGVRTNRVEIQGIRVPEEVQDSMNKQMNAERERRASILTAEGSKEAQVLEAEGEKAAAILRAEGQARAIELKAQADSTYLHTFVEKLGSEGAKLALGVRYFDTLGEMGDTTKVFLPTGLNNALGALLSQSFGKEDSSL
jgi:regulator of protease activity HflC (stomatin/prohibitin superfamily)